MTRWDEVIVDLLRCGFVRCLVSLRGTAALNGKRAVLGRIAGRWSYERGSRELWIRARMVAGSWSAKSSGVRIG